MTEHVDEAYFHWLYAKVAWREVYTPSTSFHSLLYFLHCTEYVWRLSGDDNRAEDGRDLRSEFLAQSRYRVDETWMLLDCSVLEMLIGLARRAAFATSKNTQEWFWIFLENLGLSEVSDASYASTPNLGEIVERFVWRQYDVRGRGGIFPLRYPQHDQREVELWYQFSEYVLENDID